MGVEGPDVVTLARLAGLAPPEGEGVLAGALALLASLGPEAAPEAPSAPPCALRGDTPERWAGPELLAGRLPPEGRLVRVLLPR